MGMSLNQKHRAQGILPLVQICRYPLDSASKQLQRKFIGEHLWGAWRAVGCSDPVAFPSKGAAAGSTTRTFFDFSPNSAQWCLWPGFWTRRAVLQICEPYLLLIFERRQPGCSPWPGTGRNGNGMAGDGPQVIPRFLTCHTEEKKTNHWKAECSEMLFFCCSWHNSTPIDVTGASGSPSADSTTWWQSFKKEDSLQRV